jgi:hypothetical protein
MRLVNEQFKLGADDSQRSLHFMRLLKKEIMPPKDGTSSTL